MYYIQVCRCIVHSGVQLLFGCLSESTLGSESDVLMVSFGTAMFQDRATLGFSRGTELIESTYVYIFKGICQIGLHNTVWVVHQ